jgi:hypothetical protein
MMNATTRILKACSLSMALLGSAALVTAISLPDVAFAKNGNDNGNGGGNGNGGNGNGNGGGGNSDKASSKKSDGASSEGQKSNASKKKVVKVKTAEKKKVKAKAKPKRKDLASELGVSPSDLGALNAAHASPNALANASPNSRVGRIAAYRDSVVAGEALQAELDEKIALLATLTPPDRPLTEIDADLADAIADVATKATTVAELEAALAAAGGADPVILDNLATARGELTAAQGIEAYVRGEQAAAIQYETVTAEVTDLTQQVEDQPEVERSLLEAAANKPVTDEVEAAVKLLLGL